MKVDLDTVVVVQYTLEVKDGETPQELRRTFSARFIYGRDPVLPALEKALLGRAKDEEIQVLIPPEQAFGKYDPQLVNEIPLHHLKFPEKLRVGDYYQETTANGRPMGFWVKELHEDYVVADFNHPAAGKSLLLNAKVADVRAASFAEIMQAINAAACSTGG